MRTFLPLVLALTLAACATSGGNNFNDTRVQDLRQGMTEQEVAQALGAKPTARQYELDGSYVAAWQYVKVSPLTFKSESKIAYLKFDKNKNFVSVVEFGKLINE